jgi:hypothetical protein
VATCNPCEATLDKQVSCDGGATFVEVGNGNIADACQGTTGDADIKIKYVATNTGSSNLVNCTLTDSNGGITGNFGAPGSITVGNASTLTSDLLTCSSTLTANEPDTATLNCTCGTPTSGITVTAKDTGTFTCFTPPTGCVGLSPGFWKGHLELTNKILALEPGNAIQSCGELLTNTQPLTNQSTIADVCTQPGSLQFQCTAAALDLAASALGNLNCQGSAQAAGISPDIVGDFNTCCGAGGVCATAGADVTGACGRIAAFAGAFENEPIPAVLGGSVGANTIDSCQTDQKAGFLNQCNATSNPAVPTCGTGRVYPAKKH